MTSAKNHRPAPSGLGAPALPPLSIVLEFTRTDTPEDPHAFSFAPQDYTLRLQDGRRGRLQVPWERALLDDVAALRRPDRDPVAVQRIGALLAQLLEPAGWPELARQIDAAVEEGRRTLLTICSNAAELYALPWELLTLDSSGRHLGEVEDILLRYAWPGTRTTAEAPSPRPEGGRLLFAWSTAGGPVPAPAHLQAIESSCASGHVDFSPAGDVLPHAGLNNLAQALDAAAQSGSPVTILHLLCHGAVVHSTFGLALSDADGRSVCVDAGRLRQVLSPHAGSLRLVVLLACDSGNAGEPGNHLGSVAQALHRAGIQSVVASRLPLTVEGSVIVAESLYRGLFVDLAPLEQAFTQTRAQLALEPPSLDWAALTLHARADDGDDTRPYVFRPYRGLLAFHAQHARLFFGRDPARTETRTDLQALTDADKPRFLVVAGASGTGKSSMVMAGAIPDLLAAGGVDQPTASAQHLLARARRDLEAAARSVPDPFVREALGALDRGSTSELPWSGAWTYVVLRPGNNPLASLTAALSGHTPGQRMLVVVDQFEELFTLTEDPGLRESFTRRLWTLSQGASGVSVVITIRIDFLGHCGQLVLDEFGTRLDRVAYDEAHRVFVAQMQPEQLRAAVEAPATQLGLTLEPGLTERILADAGHEPGALPLMQYTLDRLWLCREGRVLTAASYQELGGVVGALQGKADAIIDALDPAHLRQARRLLTRLVDLGDDGSASTRRRVGLALIEPSDEDARVTFHRVLALLVDARLVVRNDDAGTPTLEVAHEALIRKWPRMRAWIDADRDKIARLEALEAWVRECVQHRTLLVGARLGYATEVVSQYPADISAETRTLLVASQARARLSRGLLVGAVLLFALLGIIAFILWRSSLGAEQEARESALEAEASAAKAKANAKAARASLEKAIAAQRRGRDLLRMSAAKDQRERYLRTALAIGLLREVEAEDPHRELAGWGPQAYSLLTEPWIERATLRGHVGELRSARFSPDRARVVTASADGTARIWDALDGTALRTLKGHQKGVNSAVYSPDGSRILTVSDDGSARVWDANDPSRTPLVLHLQEGEEPANLGETEGLTFATFSPSGSRVLTFAPSGSIAIWDAFSGERLADLGLDTASQGPSFYAAPESIADPDLPSPPIFDAEGARVIAGSADHRAYVWSASTGALVTSLAGHTGPVASASFSPDGARAVTASTDGTAMIWDLASAKMLAKEVFFEHEGKDQEGVSDPLLSARFAPDGASVLWTSTWRSVLWTPGDAGSEPTTREVGRDAFAGRLSPDGGLIVARAGDSADQGFGQPLIFDARDTSLRAALGGHHNDVVELDIAEGGRMVTASRDGTARIWREEPPMQAELELDLGAAIEGEDPLRFSPGAELVLYTRSNEVFARPLIPTQRASDSREVSLGAAEFFVISPDGRRAAIWSPEAAARLHSTSTGAELAALPSTHHLEFSPDSARMVSSSIAGVVILDAVTGAQLATLENSESSVGTGVEISPRSAFPPDSPHRVAKLATDGTLRHWDMRTGAEDKPLSLSAFDGAQSDYATLAVAYTPDGASLVVTMEGEPAYALDTTSGRRVTFGSKLTAASHATIDPRGERLVTAGVDNAARVWGLTRGESLKVLRGFDGPVSHVVFSPNGDQLLTVSERSAKLWDTSSWMMLTEMTHDERILAAAFTPDGHLTLTAASDGTIQGWSADLSSSVLRRQLWTATHTCPSVEDRMEHLSDDRTTAEVDKARCDAMLLCAHARTESAAFDICLAEFRRAQRAGALVRGVTP